MKIELPSLTAANVLVVGDLMLDRYWHGDTSRISPEAPVPVVLVGESEERAGGAGNVALNISALGANASLMRSEEHTSELQSRGLISYAVFCLKKKKTKKEKKKKKIK